MFPLSQLALGLAVFLARVADVSFGTFRQAMVIRGKKTHAMALAFAESIIWAYAASKALTDLTEPITALSFASGFAIGTFVGITIEDLFKISNQHVRVFTTRGAELASRVRDAWFRATMFDGQGRNGMVQLVLVLARRKEARKICDLSRLVDSSCFLTIDDIRASHYSNPPLGR